METTTIYIHYEDWKNLKEWLGGHKECIPIALQNGTISLEVACKLIEEYGYRK